MALTLDPAKARLIRTVENNTAGFWCAALDGTNNRLYAGGTDFHIHAYDLPAVQPTKSGPLKGHGSYVTAMTYLPAPQLLISGSFDKEMLWWKPSAGVTPVRRVLVGARVNQLKGSADGSRVIAATDDLVGRIWDAQTGNILVELKNGHPLTTYLGRKNTIYSVEISADGKRAATGDRAGIIVLWDAATGQQLLKVAAPAFYSQAMMQGKQASEYEWGGVRSLLFPPDGTLLIAGGMGPADQNSAGIDGLMRLEAFETTTGKSRAAFMNLHKGMLTTLCMHPTGEWLIAGGGGGQAGSRGIGSLWLWNVKQNDKDGKPVMPVMHQSPSVIREVLPAPDGISVLTAGMQTDLIAGRIAIWDLTGTVAPATPPPAAPNKK